MVKYCQYCARCQWYTDGVGLWCPVKHKPIAVSSAKTTNKCDAFVYREVSILTGRKYKPMSKEEMDERAEQRRFNAGGKEADDAGDSQSAGMEGTTGDDDAEEVGASKTYPDNLIYFIMSGERVNIPEGKLDEAFRRLSDVEYDFIIAKFVNRKRNIEIADDYGYTSIYVGNVLKSAYNKLRAYLIDYLMASIKAEKNKPKKTAVDPCLHCEWLWYRGNGHGSCIKIRCGVRVAATKEVGD